MATDNLMQIIAQENTDMVMIKEPYLYQNIPKGITRIYRKFTHGNGKSRAAIIKTNNTIDALLLTHYLDEDTIILETHRVNKKFYAASI